MCAGIATFVIVCFSLFFAAPAAAVELTAKDVTSATGDGPDGKGNTTDDTWQFWFELAHKQNTYSLLTLATSTLSEAERKNGRPRKITGPIDSRLPNAGEHDGWILHTDWDGRFEGAWGNEKQGYVAVYPYVEKNFHGGVAVTYKVPKTGKYNISGKLTDMMVEPGYKKHDGITWKVETAKGGAPGKVLAKGGPIGDGHGRKDSEEFSIEAAELTEGELVRVAIDPIGWWGSDFTKIENFKIEPVE